MVVWGGVEAVVVEADEVLGDLVVVVAGALVAVEAVEAVVARWLELPQPASAIATSAHAAIGEP